jgi:hypothetical protein
VSAGGSGGHTHQVRQLADRIGCGHVQIDDRVGLPAARAATCRLDGAQLTIYAFISPQQKATWAGSVRSAQPGARLVVGPDWAVSLQHGQVNRAARTVRARVGGRIGSAD